MNWVDIDLTEELREFENEFNDIHEILEKEKTKSKSTE